MSNIEIRRVFRKFSDSEDQLHCIQYGALCFLRWIESQIGLKGHIPIALYCDEMGFGKTKVFLWLIRINPVPKTLVITTVNTMMQTINWCLDICTDFTCYIVEKEDVFSKVSRSENGNIDVEVLDEYDSLDRYSIIFINVAKLNSKKNKLIFSQRYGRIILDESHGLREGTTIHSGKNFMKIPEQRAMIDGKLSTFCSKIFVTGTPINNSVNDLKNLFLLVDPTCFDMCQSQKDDLKRLKQLVKKYMFRRTGDDITDDMKQIMRIPTASPDVTYITVKPAKTDFYDKVRRMNWKTILKKCKDKSFRKELLSDELAYLSASCQKIRETSQSEEFVLKGFLALPFESDIFEGTDYENKYSYNGPRTKEEEFIKLLSKNEDSYVIFHEYIKVEEIYRDLIEQNFPDAKIFSISGKDNLETRFNTIAKCQKAVKKGKRVFFFSSITATSDGVNYQFLSNCIFLDHRANPQQEIQAQRRLHRMGQKNEVKIFFIILDKFKTQLGTVKIDQRLIEIKNEKIEYVGILNDNAARYFKRPKVLGSDGKYTTGVRYNDEFESREKGSKNGPDSIGNLYEYQDPEDAESPEDDSGNSSESS